jgi:Aldehyde oxidase and xanthine dehydrogenase, a/b hammerhead domain/Molybdopterin-binding domain of aldehyde dehydrogenase
VSTGRRGQSVGVGLGRLDGVLKVRGRARYAYEQPVPQPAYLCPVQATIARGTVVRIDTGAAEALDGVLAVLTHLNALRLVDTKDQELLVLQSAAVGFRGQFIGAVVAESSEIARHAAALVEVEYAPATHNAAFSVGEHGDVSLDSTPGLPRQVSDAEIEAALAGEHGYVSLESTPGLPRQVSEAEIKAALATASTAVDQTYTTPPEYHVPMEPHTSVAIWNDGTLTMYESTQGVHPFREGFGGAVRPGAEPGPDHLPVCRRRIRLKAQGSRPGRTRGDGGTRTARPCRKGCLDPAADVLPQWLPSTDHPTRATRGGSGWHTDRTGRRRGRAEFQNAGFSRRSRRTGPNDVRRCAASDHESSHGPRCSRTDLDAGARQVPWDVRA